MIETQILPHNNVFESRCATGQQLGSIKSNGFGLVEMENKETWGSVALPGHSLNDKILEKK
jgi:hypothetical protein